MNSATLFDDRPARAAWRRPQGRLGSRTILEFGEPVSLDGLLVLGVPGELSKELEGLCIQEWDGDVECWRWVAGVHGPPQFQQVLWCEALASLFRFGVVGRSACAAELLFFARNHIKDQ